MHVKQVAKIYTYQFPFSLVPPKTVVPLPGLGITYNPPSTSVTARFASSLTRTVCPLIGYIAGSGTSVFAPRPVAFTKTEAAPVRFSVTCNAPARPHTVGKRALISLPLADLKEARRYWRCWGVLMQIAEKRMAVWMLGRYWESGRVVKSETRKRHHGRGAVGEDLGETLD